MDHNGITGRFVRSTDGAWRVAVGADVAPLINVGDRIQVRRRGKAPQWIGIGNRVEVLVASNEVTFEVRKRHTAPHPAPMPMGPVEIQVQTMDEPDTTETQWIDLEQTEQQPEVAPVTPVAKAPPKAAGEVEKAIQALIAATQPAAPAIDEAQIIALIQKHSKAPRTVVNKVDIKRPDGDVVRVDSAHKQFAPLLQMVAANVPTMMVGPAGSGKTSAARQVAKALDVPFYFTGAVVDRFALIGFKDGNGNIQHTQYSTAIKQPCVFLFDEGDSSAADAILAFNAAIDGNRLADLPEGQVQVHPECRFLFAANTYGRGADRMYVGRNQLDAASIDRFAVIDWDYDRDLERTYAAPAEWISRVHAVRDAIEKLKVRHIVSGRAIVQGAALFAQGMDQKAVESAVLWRGIDADSRAKVERAL